MVKKALALGSATTLFPDLDAVFDLGVEFDVVVAANEAGVAYSGRIDAWVTLHPDEIAARIQRRSEARYESVPRVVSHVNVDGKEHRGITERIDYKFKTQRHSGSSGLFAVKYALVDMQCDRVVCCGIPLEEALGRIDGKPLWRNAPSFRPGWLEAKTEIADKVRSMSGWTARIFGMPTLEWLESPSR